MIITSVNYIIIILLFSSKVTQADKIKGSLVKAYINRINIQREKALKYEFPSDARSHEAKNKFLKDYGEFDFIIIGAGSTGCVIANRLSEISKWKVLLLEAGTYRDDDLTGIPAFSIQDALSKFNWGFKSIPQKYACQGNTDKICPVARGKGVGGTSLINWVLYSRGNRLDFQRWADLLDDPSWNYENVLPYFKKSENFKETNPYSPIDKDYHGYDGPQHLTHALPPNNITSNVIRGLEELGYNKTDYDGRKQVGGSALQFYIKKGKRFDTGMAFIEPIRHRDNLVVLDKSYVTKIKINTETKKAEGVIFTRENKTYFAKSRKEVILSAGAISSPQILMLSGIGPKDHLKALEIPLIENLPVGKKLHDHTVTFVVFSSNITNGSEPTEKSVRDLLNGEGSLTRSVAIDAVSFLQVPRKENEDYPNIELSFTNFTDYPLTQKLFLWNNETSNAIKGKATNTFVIYLTPSHPKSIGSVKLKSSDPFEYPLIDLNMLSDDDDMEVLYKNLLTAQRLTETVALRRMNVTLAVDSFPGCEHKKPLSKEYWFCYFRKMTGTGNHPISTCTVGSNPDVGVVDKDLKVFGIGGLRVADSSVIPFNLAAHPNAACTMIGEKISDVIKKCYKHI